MRVRGKFLIKGGAGFERCRDGQQGQLALQLKNPACSVEQAAEARMAA
jgi:hypothetical protein